MFDKDESRAVVNKDAPAFVIDRQSFAEGIKGTSQESRFKMIDRHGGSRAEMVYREVSHVVRLGNMSNTACGSTMRFCIFAGCTLEGTGIAFRGAIESWGHERGTPKNSLTAGRLRCPKR